MTDTSAITLIEDAIHNPGEPRHFMQLAPAAGTRVVTVNGQEIARSDAATIVKEVGRNIYDPVVYFPRDDVRMDLLASIDKSTHCPLKGDTEYFDVDSGGDRIAEVAWSYVEMIANGPDRLDALKGLVAFDTSKVTLS